MRRLGRVASTLVVAAVVAGCGAPGNGQLAIARDESGVLVAHAETCGSDRIDRISIVDSNGDAVEQVELARPLPRGASTTQIEATSGDDPGGLSFADVGPEDGVGFAGGDSTASGVHLAGPEATLETLGSLQPGQLLVTVYDDDGAIGSSVVDTPVDEWRAGAC